jgi:hypothetical protein
MFDIQAVSSIIGIGKQGTIDLMAVKSPPDI